MKDPLSSRLDEQPKQDLATNSLKRERTTLTPTLERNLEINRLHAVGASYSQLARAYGISRARVQQICDHLKGKKVHVEPYHARKVQRTLTLARGHMAELTRQLRLLETEIAELELVLRPTNESSADLVSATLDDDLRSDSEPYVVASQRDTQTAGNGHQRQKAG